MQELAATVSRDRQADEPAGQIEFAVTVTEADAVGFAERPGRPHPALADGVMEHDADVSRWHEDVRQAALQERGELGAGCVARC